MSSEAETRAVGARSPAPRLIVARNALLAVLDDLDPALIGLAIVLALGVAVALGFVAATPSEARGAGRRGA